MFLVLSIILWRSEIITEPCKKSEVFFCFFWFGVPDQSPFPDKIALAVV